jgi:chemotaxis response regulator CheB
MRIGVVNDMPMAIEGLRRVIQSSGAHKVIWTAFSGKEALEYCAADRPDLVLMDIIMPEMNGVETTRLIMQLTPCPILIVTSSVNKNSALVFEAMGYGALDAVNTPVLMGDDAENAQKMLLRKISMLEMLTKSKLKSEPSAPTHVLERKLNNESVSLVAFGASSGGPQALATVLKRLPSDFKSAIIIVQHVDAQFSQGLADWLDQQISLPVRLAKPGDRPLVGEVLLAGTDDHLVLTGSGQLQYVEEPKSTPYRPSVDVFWDSLREYWGGELTAVLLTGMGRDGAQSMLELRRHGVNTIAQDKESCAVFGMPKAAIAIKAAKQVCTLEAIAELLIRNDRASSTSADSSKVNSL